MFHFTLLPPLPPHIYTYTLQTGTSTRIDRKSLRWCLLIKISNVNNGNYDMKSTRTKMVKRISPSFMYTDRHVEMKMFTVKALSNWLLIEVFKILLLLSFWNKLESGTNLEKLLVFNFKFKIYLKNSKN